MDTTTNKYITVAYQLHTKQEDGEMILREETTVEHPFQFISGLEVMIPRFEQEVSALEKGASFDFVIPCDEAYGDYFPEGVHVLKRKDFFGENDSDSKHIFEGAIIPLLDNESHQHNGVIAKLTADEVTIDLNHPYAGKDLYFTGTVVESRPATNEEIQDMIKAMSGGCGCGGGCGDCGSGGCSGGCNGGNCDC